MATDSERANGEQSQRGLATEASMLWASAADLRRWGFVSESAETRRLALAKRVQSILANALLRTNAGGNSPL